MKAIISTAIVSLVLSCVSLMLPENSYATNVCVYEGKVEVMCHVNDIQITDNNTVVIKNDNGTTEVEINDELKMIDIDCGAEFKVINKNFYYKLAPNDAVWNEVPMID